MNILRLLDVHPEGRTPSGAPIAWKVFYLDGTETRSSEGTWNDLVGSPEVHDGQTLFCARKPVKQMRVHIPDEDTTIVHDVDGNPCFAQARFAQALCDVNGEGVSNPPIWLATIFGYLTPDYALILKVDPHHTWLYTLSRPFTLPW